MSGYMYYCSDCEKLYKVGAVGKKAKCARCGSELIDLNISDEEYAALDAKEKDAIKKKASGFTVEEEFSVPEQDTFKMPEPDEVKAPEEPVSQVNISLADNAVQLKDAADITSGQHATFNNDYLKTQIQAQILTAENFVSICKMSAIKNDGVIDENENKLIKNVEKITEEYTNSLKKLI